MAEAMGHALHTATAMIPQYFEKRRVVANTLAAYGSSRAKPNPYYSGQRPLGKNSDHSFLDDHLLNCLSRASYTPLV